MIYLALIILEITILYYLSRKLVAEIYGFLYQVTKRRSWTIYLYSALFLPGTFIHEISHFLAALFLLVPVGKLELLPNIEKDGGFKLGSVAIAKTDPLRRFLIGVAPLIFGLSIIFSLTYFASTGGIINTWWGNVLTGILIFQVANSMFASKKDLEGAIYLIIIIAFIIILFLIIGVRIPVNISDYSLCNKSTEILKNAGLFLSIPIIIDTTVLFIFRKLGFKKISV